MNYQIPKELIERIIARLHGAEIFELSSELSNAVSRARPRAHSETTPQPGPYTDQQRWQAFCRLASEHELDYNYLAGSSVETINLYMDKEIKFAADLDTKRGQHASSD